MMMMMMMMMMMIMNTSFILQKNRSAEYKKNSWYKLMCSNKIFQDKNDKTTQITPLIN